MAGSTVFSRRCGGSGVNRSHSHNNNVDAVLLLSCFKTEISHLVTRKGMTTTQPPWLGAYGYVSSTGAPFFN